MCQGNPDAFEKVYSHFALDLFRYGYRITSDSELVQDTIQDIFLHIWKKRHDLKEVASPRFYLYRSLRNKLIRFSETNRFVFSRDGDLADHWFPSEEDIETTWISRETSSIQLAMLQEALLKLPLRQQEVIQLRYYHDFSAEEIGRIRWKNFSRFGGYVQPPRTSQKRPLFGLRTGGSQRT